jgi:hypothetical protein
MNKEDIIRMAREAGMAGFDGTVHAMFQLERFAVLVAEAENEACAKVCESMRTYVDRHNAVIQSSATDCAAAIRARGQA